MEGAEKERSGVWLEGGGRAAQGTKPWRTVALAVADLEGLVMTEMREGVEAGGWAKEGGT